MNIKSVYVIVFLFMSSLLSHSQTAQDTSLVNIQTTDGNEYLGHIVSQDSLKIILKTEKLGEISIFKSDIKKQGIVEIQQVKDGKFWFPNPQSTRYFWAPNGYGLAEGEGYYQNIWVLWNQFAYGLTNNFSIGGAVIPMFLFGGAPTPAFLTAKFSIPLAENQVNLGTGVIAGTVLGESNTTFGLIYGLSTFGSHDANFSAGLGFGFAGGDMSSTPIFNFGGLKRLSNRFYVVTENYLIIAEGEAGMLLSFGGRSILRKAALDFGFFIPVIPDMGTFVALPWLGFTVPFGNTTK